MRSQESALTVAFYLGLALLALFAYWTPLQDLVPEGRAPQISRNNEAYVFVVIAIIYLAFGIRDRVGSGAVRVVWFLAVLVGFVFTEFFAVAPEVPQTIVTLNEGFLGLLIVALYLELSRHRTGQPIPSLRPPFYALVILIPLLAELPIGGWEGTGLQIWIVDHAEAWGFAILTAALLDFVRPWPTGTRPSRTVSVVWYIALVAIPFLIDQVNPHGVDSAAAVGPVESFLVWIQRITEAFVAAFLLTVWFDLRALATQRSLATTRER